MARYLQLARYTAAGAKGNLDEGLVNRVEAARTAIESMGGSLEGYWMVEGGQWHAAQLFELPDQPGRTIRAGLQIQSSGAIDDYCVLRLVDPADVDTMSEADWRPPGAD